MPGAVGAGLSAVGTGIARNDRGASQVEPFRGEHQGGITTPVQSHLHCAAFDVTTTDQEALEQLLQRWTTAAHAMSRGNSVGGGGVGEDLAPPDDTGEAVDHSAARLTLTSGLGPSLFDDRLGLRKRRPSARVDLPAFPPGRRPGAGTLRR